MTVLRDPIPPPVFNFLCSARIRLLRHFFRRTKYFSAWEATFAAIKANDYFYFII